jgi:hypothetical protein
MNTRSTTRNLEDLAPEAGEASQRMESAVEEPAVQDNPSGSSGTVGDSEEEALRRRLDVLRAENQCSHLPCLASCLALPSSAFLCLASLTTQVCLPLPCLAHWSALP